MIDESRQALASLVIAFHVASQEVYMQLVSAHSSHNCCYHHTVSAPILYHLAILPCSITAQHHLIVPSHYTMTVCIAIVAVCL